MAESQGPVDVSKELASLRHEMKNQKMKGLPSQYTVRRRPLHHAPIASPYAGSHVQKVVYVSCHTPVMSAVKRVKKMLFQIEQRAAQGSNTNKPRDFDKTMADLTEASDRIAKTREEVLVKASGRAMSQALRIGDWFRQKEQELACKVETRTGSVRAVDDIVETEINGREDSDSDDAQEERKPEEPTVLEGGETTLELLGDASKSLVDEIRPSTQNDQQSLRQSSKSNGSQIRKRKRARRKKPKYEEGDVPEARLRWVKTVEIAISLRA